MATAPVSPAGESDEREAFGAYVCDDETGSLIESLAREHGWPPERIHKGGIANAVRSLSVMRSPEFLIVDLSESEEPRGDISALADVCEPGTVVLAVGATNDVHLYRDLLSSGIHDYLLKPVDSGELRESVSLMLTAMAAPAAPEVEREPAEQRKIAVVGCRGGVGASTVATGLAWILAEELHREAALLDLDIQFGTAALSFDLEPGRGLADALENPNRVDSLFIDRATLKVSERLSILGSELPLAEAMTFDPAAMQHLQEELANSFQTLIVDLPRGVASAMAPSLDMYSDFVLVTDLTLAATRDTIRLLAFLEQHAPGGRVHLVASKVAPAAQQEVSQKDFEASIERELDLLVPLDVKSAVAAAKQGKTLPQAMRHSKSVNQLRQLARRFTGEAAAEEGSFVKKLLRKAK